MLKKILNPKISALALDGEVDYTLELTSPITRTSFKDQSLLCSVIWFKMDVSKSIGNEEYLEGKCIFPTPRERSLKGNGKFYTVARRMQRTLRLWKMYEDL